MFFKEFEIRWGDLDANGHLGNASYIAFMSHTRMSFFSKQGLSLEAMRGMGLGPIALYEHIHYFREMDLNDQIRVSLEIVGWTEDAQFIKIEHNFYNQSGQNLAFSEILFSWIDLKTRKLGRLSPELRAKLATFPKSERFNILTKSNIRKDGIRPKDL
ncbi:MAG: thioesterase family protein [Flavobacteriaceae bacterium]|nr:thioesterase family protein [Bacteroidia bacterium]MBT8288889.1 thioesterase family protein [Bacteroidia bacterium]NNF74072.1 thioesterase family protein [Flavobacteriaceae bacterium]NNK73570.1 thioesterase family protein [Flavobacteriaceae bacterium]